MSNLIRILNRLVAALFSSERIQPDPENMCLRDWADLPAHHPVRDGAPC
ncbi:hypothetical protein [Devosia psychrophila]|jgi:hypothetical protein|uniref:Uncharacterized protein n=1 Tax=Devosia psychrophila TaxID=728005 RepID=A0A1I1FKM3_9HYPH|nr:hypothetical protein [Devosia psychrophila]SFB99542.1 hypothetical protein SAMN04488059_101303 [Devosia psychrophila]